jgi:thioredoxin
MKKSATLRPLLLSAALALLSLGMCGAKSGTTSQTEDKAVTEITSVEQFSAIVNQAGDKLLGFDLYADWCNPCRLLTPRLEKIAQEHKARVIFYRINVDKLPQLAKAFRVSSIPLVAFVKNKTVVAGLQGLQPESEYVAAIIQHATEIEPAMQGGAGGS